MPANKGLGHSFDTVAHEYDKMRPGYPDALYDAVFAYMPVDAASVVAEVGSGAGQATEAFLQTGCSLVAIEPGANFGTLLREKFAKYPGFSLVPQKFEDAVFPPDTFDLVFSASAFHWVPEEVGYPAVYAMLRRGGAFARFANHPDRFLANPDLSRAIDEVYAKYYYPYHNLPPRTLTPYDASRAEQRAQIAAGYGFTDIRCHLFHRERRFLGEEYIALLGTYSDHIAIEPVTRSKFFAAVAAAIDAHGGILTLHDTLDLQLARKV